MARYEITSPDGSRYEVTAPESATEAEVMAYVQSQWKPKADWKPASPTEGMGPLDTLFAGIGKGMTDIGRGVGQRLGLVDQASIDEARKLDAPLADTTGGAIGGVIGNVAAAAPLAFIPGANSVAGAAAIGGALGAAQPTSGDESALVNTATGAALGGGAQYGLGQLSKFLAKRLASAEQTAATTASQNSVRDATLKAAQDSGYVVPPSQAGAGLGSRLLEGVSGKYKTNQAAAIKNQGVTNALARKALGLAEDAPITREALQGVRDKAFQEGYEPIASLGAIKTDDAYAATLGKIVADRQGAARSFPGAVKNEVADFVDTLRVDAFDAGDAIKMTRILREDAGAAYAKGDKALGKAMREASDALEGQIERHLQSLGKNGADALRQFREARTLMAKAHSVERALVAEGGNVNAKVLAAALQKGKPLSGDLKTIGAFARNFGDVTRVPESGWANPLTVVDIGYSLGMAPFSPTAAALPAARIAARKGLLSGPYQRSFVKPDYSPGASTTLPPLLAKKLEELGAGGLLGGSIYSPQ